MSLIRRLVSFSDREDAASRPILMSSSKVSFQAIAVSLSKSPLPGLSAIAALAVLVHGYHLGVDDSAIYVPAIKRVADPHLYPFGAEFFMSHAHLSFFAELVGG